MTNELFPLPLRYMPRSLILSFLTLMFGKVCILYLQLQWLCKTTDGEVHSIITYSNLEEKKCKIHIQPNESKSSLPHMTRKDKDTHSIISMSGKTYRWYPRPSITSETNSQNLIGSILVIKYACNRYFHNIVNKIC